MFQRRAKKIAKKPKKALERFIKGQIATGKKGIERRPRVPKVPREKKKKQ